MRIVVGYLATPSGEDGLALGVRLARSLGARLDICLVIPPDRTVPARVPADPGYEDVLVDQAHAWLTTAMESVPEDIEAQTHLSFHESLAQGLLDETARLGAHAIVIGAAGDGLVGRHAIGSVSGELLHSSPVPLILAPKGTRHSNATHVREVTCALGTREGAEVLLQTALRASQRMDTPLRLVSLVSLGSHPLFGHRSDAVHANEAALVHTRANLEVARSVLPDDFPITTQLADGATVESAASKLEWHDGDLIMVGSSRLAQPHRLFLGSTAAKMLRVVPVPMVVVPQHEPLDSE
ncbi:universal stress protein [Rhodococcus sp. NPDC059234]|uniref:universal stress protein n=1 Tax=Rhodococcus sp. NPDC059234 TaxID=3346781 RepID=UPI00366A851B